MTSLYHYTDCGLPNVWLSGVQVHDTPYGPGTSIPGLEDLHNAIALSIVEANRQMSGPEVRFLRTELDLSQRTLARLLDVQENTVRRWEHADTHIPGPAQRALAGFYVESIRGGGSLRDLMLKLAEKDRDLAEIELRFERDGERWRPLAA